MKHRAVRWLDIGAVIALLLTALGWIGEARGWFDPHPFRDVRDVSAVIVGDALEVRATYIRSEDDCRFQPPAVLFGHMPGGRLPLAYVPVRGANQGAARMPGEQFMHLRVEPVPGAVSRVEVWTLYLCGPDDKPHEALLVDVPVTTIEGD